MTDPQRAYQTDVRDYGAIGDFNGVTGTDNHAAFTAALAATPPGGKVWVPPGIYYLSQTLAITKPIDFDCGAGGGEGAQRGTELWFPAGVTGIHVERPGWWRIGPFDLHALSIGEGCGHGVHIATGPGTVDRTTATGFSGHGFFVDGNLADGGGNVHKTVLSNVGAYRNRGDGIQISGGGANVIRVAYPDLVANHGWGLKMSAASWCHVLSPHFDQAYSGSPGAVYDQGLANTVESAYFEGGGNGRVVYLDTESYYFRGTWAKVAAGTVTGPGAAKGIIERRGDGWSNQVAILGKNGTKYVISADIYGGGSIWHNAKMADGAEYTTMVADRFGVKFGQTVTPLKDGTYSLGSTSRRWKNVNTSGYVGCGAFATTDRPTGAPAGGMIFDVTLARPIWFDGTVWRDAAGTEV